VFADELWQSETGLWSRRKLEILLELLGRFGVMEQSFHAREYMRGIELMPEKSQLVPPAK
jgi:hypothetical protein